MGIGRTGDVELEMRLRVWRFRSGQLDEQTVADAEANSPASASVIDIRDEPCTHPFAPVTTMASPLDIAEFYAVAVG